MTLAIIIRKKDRFSIPVKLSVRKVRKHGFRKAVNARKRGFWQKLRANINLLTDKRRVYRIEGQIAMF